MIIVVNCPALRQTARLEKIAHETLLRHFHDFAVIGGMPEVVKRFVADQSMANLPDVFDNLWQTYFDDVEKYAKSPKERNAIRYVMRAAASEKDRISFAQFAASNYGKREVRDAFQTLDMARIIHEPRQPLLRYPPAGQPLLRRGSPNA